MNIIYCPKCGKELSTTTEKCPNCDFETQEYFKTPRRRFNIVSTLKKYKYRLFFVLLAIFIVSFIAKNIHVEHTHVQPTAQIDNKASNSLQNNDTTPNTNKPTSNNITSNTPIVQNESTDNNVVGVYRGDDGEILLISSNYYAYYYCDEKAFTELQCPWYIENDTIYIVLSRLHCTIYAKLADSSELLFKADSVNWNTELFTKTKINPEDYSDRTITPYDCNAIQNPDGTLNVTFNKISYTLDKAFYDMEDDFDDNRNYSIFIDADADSNYISSIMFCLGDDFNFKSINDEKHLESFISSFFTNCNYSYYKNTNIATMRAAIYNISGYLNEGFGGEEGYNINGYIVLIDNSNTHTIDLIQIVESPNRELSKGDKILDFFDTAF